MPPGQSWNAVWTLMTARQLSCFQSIKIDFIDIYCPPHLPGSQWTPFELRWLPDNFLAFSRFKLISLIATALHASRAVANPRFDLWWLPDNFLAFSRQRLISSIATALHTSRAVNERRLNFDDCPPEFLLSVDNDWFHW